MKRWRRRRLLVPVTIGLVLGLSGGALAAFAATTTDGPNRFIAAADWEAPHVTRTVIAKTVGYLAGSIHQGGQFFVYAQIDDGGNPPAGVGTVTADVSAFSNGGGAVPMVAGAFSAARRAVQLSERHADRDQPDGERHPHLLVHDVRRRRPRAFADPDRLHGDHRQHGTRSGQHDLGEPCRRHGGPRRAGRQHHVHVEHPIDPESLIPGWDGGSPTTVTVRLTNNGNNDRIRIRGAAGNLNFGTVRLQQNYVPGTARFHRLVDHDARQQRHDRAREPRAEPRT